MVYLVHFQEQLLHHIMPDELKVDLANEVRHVLLAACEKVVHADDLQAYRRQNAPALQVLHLTLQAGRSDVQSWSTQDKVARILGVRHPS